MKRLHLQLAIFSSLAIAFTAFEALSPAIALAGIVPDGSRVSDG